MDRIVYERLDRIEGQHWWFRARRSIIAAAIARFAPRRQNLKLLEAGCGTGGNLQMLSGFGTLDAFELDAEARNLARAKLPIDVKPGMLPEGVPFQPGQHDLVGAFDVLEHVEHDVESLARLGQQLAPGGRLIVTVPALPWLWSKHDETHHHFRRYTRSSLMAALQAAGLQPVHVSYFNTLLFPLIAGLRLLRRVLGLSETADDTLPPKPVNALLAAIFACERNLATWLRLPIGVSLLAVAERRA